MIFSAYIQDLLRQKCCSPLRLPCDVERLALDIESATGEHIGVNTMKRLLGFISDERQPRLSTLDVIARYLGYDCWETLQALDDKSNSAFESDANEVRSCELCAGQRVAISYLPDRRLLLEYTGNGAYRVMESENSKLMAGDELWLTHLVKGYPLLVSRVIRQGHDLGAFTAGKTQGIDFQLL